VKLYGHLDRLLLREMTRLFAATLGGVVLIYLVIDFADRAHGFTGRAWGKPAAELYLNKAAVVGYQLAPAALIIAATLLIALLGRRGELTAMLSVGVRPLRLALPIAVFAALLGAASFWLNEKVVVHASARIEEIQVKRFNNWGDWATYHAGSSWLRGQNGRVYHLGPQRDGGWEPATVLEIGPPFRLTRRLVAHRLEPVGARGLRFVDVQEIRYGPSKEPGGSIEEHSYDELREVFPESAADLLLRSGRPQQLPFRQLREQMRLRAQSGQPAKEFELTIAERVAQPLQAVPAALAALGISIWLQRPRRRVPIAAAVAVGIGLSLVLWAASVVVHALAMGGSLGSAVAAAAPAALSTLCAIITFRRG
jgi:lipopolysaccharide export LptBFGC system permease protein LptF